jgi:hypothetical protein
MQKRPSIALVTLAVVVCATALPTAAQVQGQQPQGAQTPLVAPAASPAPARAPLEIPRWARVSFFAQASSTTGADGSSSSFSEIVTNVAAQSAQHAGDGFEYGLDARFGAYPSTPDRNARTSVYDAFVAQRLMEGRVLVKAGQMWLNDLGGLGSVGGALVEVRQSADTTRLRWRAGGFGGVEPEIMDVGYVSGIRKFGGYFALDGNGAQRSVIGYVNVRNQNLTERSVLSFTNYIPVQQSVFVYQAAEVDLSGPGGQGSGGLTYFFVNARVAPAKRSDVQLTYHRGRSIDARSITDDLLNGRPVPARTLDGFLFESIGARLTVEVAKGVRVFGGYGQDKNDRDADPMNRLSFGVYSSSVLGTGIDVNITDYRYTRGSASSYDSWYVSAGRSFGSRCYLSGEYTTSLSVLRYARADGFMVENRPKTDRLGASANIYLSRMLSLLVVADYTRDEGYKETRILSGLSTRF